MIKGKITSKLILAIIFAIVSSSSCKYHCGGFPEEELGWLPYELGDTLTYCSPNDSVQLIVNDYFTTEPYSFKSFPVMDYECGFEGFYSTNASNNIKIREEIGTYELKFVSYISDQDIFRYNPFNQYGNSDSLSIEIFLDTLISGHRYQNIYKVNKIIMLDIESIQWILKSEGNGIIGFYNRNTNEEWLLK